MGEIKDTGTRRKYTLGILLIVVGAIGFIAFVVFLLKQIGEQSPKIQIVVPGIHEIQIVEPGRYTIFYEYRSVVDGKVFLTGESLPSEIFIALHFKDGFQEVTLLQPSMNNTYSIGGRAGVSLLEFTVEKPGTYVISASYAKGTQAPDVVLAIGQFKIFQVVFGAIAIFFVSLIITITGCLIILVAYLKSRKIKKEAQTQ